MPQTGTATIRGVLQAAALVVAGSLLGLALSELLARAIYERPWYDRLAEDQQVSESLPYRLNSYGLRGADFAVPKPDGVRRVYMAGDSFTFGMGVLDDELVMPSRVERSLGAQLPAAGNQGVEVLNAGIIGSLPAHWWHLWQRAGPAFDPDVVLIVFFLRDGTPTRSIPDFFGVVRDEITERNAADPLYQASYLWRMVRDARDRRRVADDYTASFRAAYFGSEEEQQQWLSAQYHLVLLQRAAEEMGAVVGLVIYPILVDLDRDAYPFQDICDLLEELAERMGVPSLNLLDAFRGEDAPDLWVSSYDQHPNERAHAIAAEAITPFVAELLRSAESGAQGASQP